MKIVFVSNYLNHHQTALCDNIQSKVDTFYFIYGYKGKGSKIKRREERDYTMFYKDNPQKAKEEILSADAVIFGSCSSRIIDMRMKDDKLSFVYSERFFKKSVLQRFKTKNIKALQKRFLDFKDKNLYVLAASAFLSYDLSHYKFPIKKVFKWGYFPDTKDVETYDKKENSILYVGRFLKCKHIETVIKTAKRLKKDKFDFKISIIGDGQERAKLHSLVKKHRLGEYVEFLGIKSHQEVMQIMGEHKIFMFTSDFQEGWGAVVNEAMANGCAVVASSAAGSTPFLIQHNQNGKIYKYGNNKDAYKLVKELLLNREEAQKLGENARNTIKNEYNSEVAAERLVEAVKEFYETGSITPHESGVFSQANIIKNNWFKP